MTIAELRSWAKQRLDVLPTDKLRLAAEFLDFLGSAASRDATVETLQVPGLLKAAKQSAAQIKGGRHKEWRKVRKDVHR